MRTRGVSVNFEQKGNDGIVTLITEDPPEKATLGGDSARRRCEVLSTLTAASGAGLKSASADRSRAVLWPLGPAPARVASGRRFKSF